MQVLLKRGCTHGECHKEVGRRLFIAPKKTAAQSPSLMKKTCFCVLIWMANARFQIFWRLHNCCVCRCEWWFSRRACSRYLAHKGTSAAVAKCSSRPTAGWIFHFIYVTQTMCTTYSIDISLAVCITEDLKRASGNCGVVCPSQTARQWCRWRCRHCHIGSL